jgi:gamma-glutamyl:cysteine ligase YbdK (ATP-grasp superfamily)
MERSTIGAELELYLIDGDGMISNKAPLILNDPAIKEKGCYCMEGTHAQVEVNSDPFPTIDGLHQDLSEKVGFLEDVCAKHGISAVPVSEYGAGLGEIGKHPRSDVYPHLIGTGRDDLYHHSGIHLHLSQVPGRELEQFHLLQALDALTYAYSSTSPISYKGVNSLNCHRINNQRNIAFKAFPLHAKLQDYPASLDEIETRNQKRHQQWSDILVGQGIVSKEKYQKDFKPDNTGYHSIRKRDHIGPTGTLEVRSPDTAPLDVLDGVAALIKGVHDYAMERGIPVYISDNPKYSFSDKRIIVPHIDELLRNQDRVIEDGLKQDQIIRYANQIIPLAQKGLALEDLQYLDLIKYMTKTRTNPADMIMNHLRGLGYTGEKFDPDQAAQGMLFMRDWHRKTLNYESNSS